MRTVVGFFVAFALILRSLLAPGVMFGPDGTRDTFTVVLCTGHGPETITLDANGNPVKPAQSRQDGGLCPYASSAPVASALPNTIAAPARFAQTTADYLALPAHIPATRGDGSASARGPPLYA